MKGEKISYYRDPIDQSQRIVIPVDFGKDIDLTNVVDRGYLESEIMNIVHKGLYHLAIDQQNKVDCS